jgi:ABC-2 type transporter.
MYADLLSYKRPKIRVYVTESFMVPGTFSYKTFLEMANLASGAVQREVLRAKGLNDNQIMGLIQPILIDSHYIGNPWTNYGVYLVNIILPGILQLVIIMMTVFSIGFELKRRTSREWLKEANGSIVAAITGKMLPYTILYLVLGFFIEILLYKILNYPLAGSLFTMFTATFLLIIAAQAIGFFMIGLFPVLRDALSFASIFSILSLSLAGMTFPLESMPGPIWMIGQLFPLRYYYLIYVHAGMLGGGYGSCWYCFIALLCFILLPLLVIKRLESAMVKMNYPIK